MTKVLRRKATTSMTPPTRTRMRMKMRRRKTP
jgi:hypothetical protein